MEKLRLPPSTSRIDTARRLSRRPSVRASGRDAVGGGGSGGGDNDPARRIGMIKAKLVDMRCPMQDIVVIERALSFANDAFKGLLRHSGEPAIVHSLDVVDILIDHLMVKDMITLVAAALHDVKEDTSIGLDRIRAEFGDEVASIVDALSKVPKTHFKDDSVRYTHNRTRLFSLAANDYRIVLIKLADRLSNMRTLEFVRDAQSRQRIALETFNYYVPLANVVGAWVLKRPLEDLSFLHLYPNAYLSIREHLDSTVQLRQAMMEYINSSIERRLRISGIDLVRFASKPRTTFSLYADMHGPSLRSDVSGSLRKVFDAYARFNPLLDLDMFNIVIPYEGEARRSLDALKAVFFIPENSVADFISAPKPNFYRSLNAQGVTQDMARVHLKIRTEEMEAVNDRGIAAWIFEFGRDLPPYWGRLSKFWRSGIKHSTDPDRDIRRFMSLVTIFHESIPYVLPAGSTVFELACLKDVEFALKVNGASVNGINVPLSKKLSDGAKVGFIFDEKQRSMDRKKLSKLMQGLSPDSQGKIRDHLSKLDRVDNMIFGRMILEQVLGEFSISYDEFVQGDPKLRDAMLKQLSDHLIDSYGNSFVLPLPLKNVEDICWSLGALYLTKNDIIDAIFSP